MTKLEFKKFLKGFEKVEFLSIIQTSNNTFEEKLLCDGKIINILHTHCPRDGELLSLEIIEIN